MYLAITRQLQFYFILWNYNKLYKYYKYYVQKHLHTVSDSCTCSCATFILYERNLAQRGETKYDILMGKNVVRIHANFMLNNAKKKFAIFPNPNGSGSRSLRQF